MSFARSTSPQASQPLIPTQELVPPASERKTRLATGGRASTFLGSIGRSAAPPAGPTLTGTNG